MVSPAFDSRIAYAAIPEIEALRRLAPGKAGFAELLAQLASRQRRSLEWHDRARRSGAGLPAQLPYESPLLPVYVDRADGSRIVDVDGNEYVDCHLGYTASVLGHRRAHVDEAVARALEAGAGPGLAVPAQVRLCELICAITGADRAALFHTGGEALMAAVRLCRAATGRRCVAKFEGCYHGATELGLRSTTMLLSGRVPDALEPSPATAGVGGDAPELVVLPYGEEAAFERIADRADALAAVVVDPAPMFAAERLDDAAAFLRRLARVTADAGIPLVVDEVVSGFRLARGGAQEAYGFRASIACYGKICGGAGLPVTVLAGDAAILDLATTAGPLQDYPDRRAWVTSTFAANPLAVAAALQQLTYVTAHHDRLFECLDRGQGLLRAAVDDIARRAGVPLRIHGHPRLQPLLVIGSEDAAEPAGDGWYREALRRGRRIDIRSQLAATLYLRLFNVHAKSAPTMATSCAHTDEDIALVAEAIDRSVTRMVSDGLLSTMPSR